MSIPLTERQQERLEMYLVIIRREQPVALEVINYLDRLEQSKVDSTILFWSCVTAIRVEKLYRPMTQKVFFPKYCGFTADNARKIGMKLKKLLQAQEKSVPSGNASEWEDDPEPEKAPDNTPAWAILTPEQEEELKGVDLSLTGLEGLDGPQTLAYVQASEDRLKAEADFMHGGEIVGMGAKAVRLLGKMAKKCQQRHPSFDKAQDLIEEAARLICIEIDLKIPAWAQIEETEAA